MLNGPNDDTGLSFSYTVLTAVCSFLSAAPIRNWVLLVQIDQQTAVRPLDAGPNPFEDLQGHYFWVQLFYSRAALWWTVLVEKCIQIFSFYCILAAFKDKTQVQQSGWTIRIAAAKSCMVLLQHINQDQIHKQRCYTCSLYSSANLTSYSLVTEGQSCFLSIAERLMQCYTESLLEKGKQLAWYKAMMCVLISFLLPPLRIMENLCFDFVSP